MRKRRFYYFVSIVMCSVLILSGASFIDRMQKDNQVTYSVSKTTSVKKKLLKTTTKASGETEPYFAKQWALNNDGTFVPETNSNSNSNPNKGFPIFDDPFFGYPDSWDDIDFSDNFWDDFFDFPTYDQIDFYYNLPEFRNIWIIDHSNTYQGKSSSRSFSNVKKRTAEKGIDIAAKNAWDTVGNEGREVVVAVIDTGFDFTHEELSNALWTNKEEIADDGIDNDKNGYIDDVYGWNFYDDKPLSKNIINSDYDHGTHVAGIISAAKNQTGIAGITSNNSVKIMNLKVLGGNVGKGDTDSLLKAIKYAEAMGASICNLSFGTSENDETLYNAMKKSDMLFVCAAGNGNNQNIGYNSDNYPTYPASYDLDNIISVANLAYDGDLDTTSNYGKTSVDIAAPGAYILSTITNNEYAYMSGSSMAAPMVSAVAAMVYSYHKDISLTDTKNIVLSSAKQLDTLKNKVATSGMLNAYHAVTYKK